MDSLRLAIVQSQPQNSTISCGYITIGEQKNTQPIQHPYQGFSRLVALVTHLTRRVEERALMMQRLKVVEFVDITRKCYTKIACLMLPIQVYPIVSIESQIQLKMYTLPGGTREKKGRKRITRQKGKRTLGFRVIHRFQGVRGYMKSKVSCDYHKRKDARMQEVVR